MPVIVDEVVISVEVGTNSATDPSPATSGSERIDIIDRHALVIEVVERVMDILRLKEER